jgi:hypothetical protein
MAKDTQLAHQDNIADFSATSIAFDFHFLNQTRDFPVL